MKRKLLLTALCLFIYQIKANAIPSQITYQGTLKQNGVPVNTPQPMTFQLVASDGLTPYSVAISATVPVHNGLFSIALDFQLTAGHTWETINPYILVTVNNVVLQPVEPVTATVYSLVSANVVDGSITPAKINTTAFQAAGPGLVPSGAIMMFDKDCPAGWTRDAAFDARFPYGGSIYGNSGGTATHNVSISGAVRGGVSKVGTPTGAGNGQYLEDVANQFDERASGHTHTISFDGQPGETFNQLPPYISVIYCKKD